MGKVAAVFGATGLVGSELVLQLIGNELYSSVLIFNRRAQDYTNPKIEEIILEDKAFVSAELEIKADDLFCCVGTTAKKAGTRFNYEKVDVGIPVWLARTAIKNGIKNLLIVSSVGADEKSSNSYLRNKGRMEQTVLENKKQGAYFFRPSLLLGNRDEPRFAETIGQKLMQFTGFMMIGKLKKYKAIPATIVAKAMMKVANGAYSKHFFESDELWGLTKS
ncbi:MAG: hypothetical protein B6I20_06845 [Bacteroidetes bacterium 4572_117]|nr:MAG: hypothetical protein B6I20_06845 [Bacteroidetes bacterium 4572_117]